MASEAEARISFVLRTVEERGIHFIRLWFVDVLGMLKSLAEAREVVRNSFEVQTFTPQNAERWQEPYGRFLG